MSNQDENTSATPSGSENSTYRYASEIPNKSAKQVLQDILDEIALRPGTVATPWGEFLPLPLFVPVCLGEQVDVAVWCRRGKFILQGAHYSYLEQHCQEEGPERAELRERIDAALSALLPEPWGIRDIKGIADYTVSDPKRNVREEGGAA